MTEFKNKSRILTFFLQNASEGIIQLSHAPDGWAESGFSYTRSKFYGGVNRKYALKKLGFVKEGKAFIERVLATQGFEAEITIIIWEMDFSIYSNFELFRGNLKLVDKNGNRLKINVPIVDSSFEDKVLNREDVNIIVTKRTETENYTSIDGKTILGFTNENRLVTLPSRIDFLSSIMTSDRTLTYFSNEAKDPIIPLILKGDSNDDNVKGNLNEFKSVNGAFYVNSTNADAAIEMQGSVNLLVTINSLDFNVSDIEVILYIIDNTDTITKQVNINVTKTLIPAPGVVETYSVVGDVNINKQVPINSYVQIGVMKDGTAGLLFSPGTIIDFSINTQTDTSQQVNIQTTLVHEAFARIGQKITGVNNPFYSDLLGRKNSEPRFYDFDGDDSFLAIANGALIRGFKMTNRATSVEPIAPLSISLKELFSACSVKRPIGMGIETIGGNKVFRIEKLPYFFDTRIALFIDNATDIKEEFNKDLISNEFQAGYTKFETDEILNGFFDYNTKSVWANAITTVKDKLSKISKYSASNASINRARSVDLSRENKPTTDSKYDDINFLIDVVENQVGNLVLNPNADNGTADWQITTGVTTGVLIGNPKFILQPRLTENVQVFMRQELAAISAPIISLSYAVISSDQLILTPTVQISALLNTGEFRSLNINGEWVSNSIAPLPMNSINGVLSTEFQSMNSFDISAEFLGNINKLIISFDTDFLIGKSGTNELIIDDVYISSEAEYKARTTEGFESVTGITNSNDSYNLLRTPARSLRAWGFVLRAFLEDKLNTFFSFADTEKNSTLVSKLNSESFSVSEGQDVRVSDLDTPIWTVEKISFDANLSASQRRSISGTFDDGKPKILGLAAYRQNINEPYQYGWFDDLNLNGIGEIAKVEIRPISKYPLISEEVVALDDDLIEFTDDDNETFIIE